MGRLMVSSALLLMYLEKPQLAVMESLKSLRSVTLELHLIGHRTVAVAPHALPLIMTSTFAKRIPYWVNVISHLPALKEFLRDVADPPSFTKMESPARNSEMVNV
jgi:hypothetical protein